MKPTRFRAYQLKNEGSSFSYFDGVYFTLIEARLTEHSETSLNGELKECGLKQIHILHITSWDDDHCRKSELEKILEKYKPQRIEYPGYAPSTDTGKACEAIIRKYSGQKIPCSENSLIRLGLLPAAASPTPKSNNNIIYLIPNNLKNGKSNDESVVKFFRSGDFTVLSLGDLESAKISEYLSKDYILCTEVDVMILAHHGADNGFTNDAFLKAIKPSVAICSSNYDNQFDHPRQEIRDLLYNNKIDLYTTKTGDVIIISKSPEVFEVSNFLQSNENPEPNTKKQYPTKRSKFE